MPIFNPKMSLSDIHNNLNLSFENKPSSFLKLLEKHIHFDSFIPESFKNPWVESIFMSLSPSSGFLCCKMFLAFLLTLCSSIFLTSPMRFVSSAASTKFPMPPSFPNSEQIITPILSICLEIWLILLSLSAVKSMRKKPNTYYDTSGIELPVKENNPKFLETKLNEAKKLSSTKKDSSDSSPYAIAYSRLPDSASANPEARQQYINGHFCYALKFGILTNGLGIPRFVSFFDEDFKSAHPETAVKKTDNPDTDNEVADAKSLKPVLTDFIAILRDSFKFSRVCIPINRRNTKLEPADFDEKGIPVCPLTKEPFIYQGIVHEKGRSDRIKWTCNKAKPFNKGYRLPPAVYSYLSLFLFFL